MGTALVAALALGMMIGGAWPGASVAGVERGAVPLVRAYIEALDRHDGRAVCRLFAPALRSFEVRWDGSGIGGSTCSRVVAAHFTQYYSRHRWQAARIKGRPSVRSAPERASPPSG